jgi:predicted ester cyclase
MSEENKALQRRLFEEIWIQGNEDAIDELMGSDFVGHGVPNEIRGLDAVKQSMDALRSGLPDFAFNVELQLAEGDLVAAYWTATGTHTGDWMGIPATGKAVNASGLSISRFAGGKNVEGWTRWDTGAMMAQLKAG